MAYKLSTRSIEKLNGVHADLVKVVKRAIEITSVDFSVTEGMRSIERQKELVAKGASKTMKSRHITGHAIDVAAFIDGKVSWDWKYYEKIADAMKQAAKEVGVNIVCGIDWPTFRDGPHFELDRKFYP